MESKYLDINMTHLTQETYELLDINHAPYSFRYDEGVFISVPENDDQEAFAEFPRDLQLLLKYAWKNHARLIRLDWNAEVDVKLPVYELTEHTTTHKGIPRSMLKSNCKKINYDLDPSTVENLPFGTMIKIVWNNTREHKDHDTYNGIIFGSKIGYEDGLSDNVHDIAECIGNGLCKCYMVEETN